MKFATPIIMILILAFIWQEIRYRTTEQVLLKCQSELRNIDQLRVKAFAWDEYQGRMAKQDSIHRAIIDASCERHKSKHK